MYKIVLSLALIPVLVSGCVSNVPETKRAKQHYAAISSIVKSADKYGFGGGQITKQCEIAIDCTENDLYDYITGESLNPGGKLSVEDVCTNFLALGEEQDYNFWRRDWHETEEVDVTSTENGLAACVLTMKLAQSSEDGGSEGFVLHGQVNGHGKPIAYAIQLNSYLTQDGWIDYSVVIFTTEEVWPIPAW